jgi:hypothetical protein
VTDIGDVACTKTRIFKVSGRVIPSESIANPGGICVFDGRESFMPAYDYTRGDGTFSIAGQPEGRCRLGAYLQGANLPGARPLGYADIDVRGDMNDVEIRLDNLARVNIKIVDTKGQPVRELLPVAWPSADHRGPQSVGTETDHLGKAFVYVPGNGTFYLAAADVRDKAWLTVDDVQVTASPGQTVDGVRIVVKHAWE